MIFAQECYMASEITPRPALQRGLVGVPRDLKVSDLGQQIDNSGSLSADFTHPLRLLRSCRHRPRRRRAAEHRDELAPPDHSITSSARASSVGGTVSPSALAVARLMTRSNLVGCSIGMSAGFVPRRILSICSAARR